MAQHRPAHLDRDLSGSHQSSVLERRSSRRLVRKRPILVHAGSGYPLADLPGNRLLERCPQRLRCSRCVLHESIGSYRWLLRDLLQKLPQQQYHQGTYRSCKPYGHSYNGEPVCSLRHQELGGLHLDQNVLRRSSIVCARYGNQQKTASLPCKRHGRAAFQRYHEHYDLPLVLRDEI